MKRLSKAIGATALVVTTSTFAMGGLAEAGFSQPRVSITVVVIGANPAGVRDGLQPELYSDTAGNVAVDLSTCDSYVDNAFGALEAERRQTCDTLANGTYYLGLGGAVPPEFSVSAECTVSGGNVNAAEILLNEQNEPTLFTLGAGQTVECTIRLRAGVVAIDKIVMGGPAASTEFAIDVIDVQNAVVATAVDPSNAPCTAQLTNCALVNVNTQVNGTALAVDESAIPGWGYLLASTACDSFINLDDYFPQAQFSPDSSDGSFDLSRGDAYCQVTNRYATGSLDVETVVINDSGGTATPTDVSFEVFRSDSTLEIAETACLADGSCYDGVLPVGDYVMGYVGPAGYTVDITQVITPFEPPTEMITDDPDAAFTMEEFAQVDIVITINDPVPATTTTSTTTTTTTTVAPTTTVRATTTTALDASGVTLPSTGTSSEANGWMATLALLFVASGGALLIARRRVN